MKDFHILLTPEQDKILEAKARSAGFYHKSEYVRFVLFMQMSVSEKIDAIYKEVVKDVK